MKSAIFLTGFKSNPPSNLFLKLDLDDLLPVETALGSSAEAGAPVSRLTVSGCSPASGSTIVGSFVACSTIVSSVAVCSSTSSCFDSFLFD